MAKPKTNRPSRSKPNAYMNDVEKNQFAMRAVAANRKGKARPAASQPEHSLIAEEIELAQREINAKNGTSRKPRRD